MAGSVRRFTLGFALALLLLMMSGPARAIPPTVITVNTTAGGSVVTPGGACSLTDAVAAASAGGQVNNCVGGPGANEIMFTVTGTIFINATLEVDTGELSIVGPTFGGITIDGGGANEIFSANLGTDLTLKNLTLAHGSSTSGGAIFTKGANLTIENCTFAHNQATEGGAIYSNAATMVVTNSTFALDTATSDGGAIFNNFSKPLLVTNATFWMNSAMLGGEIFTAGGATTNLKHCLLEAPELDPAGLKQNGGPTETIALLSNVAVSDCTDQSSPTPQTIATDQRLFGRINSPTQCSAGAYEFEALAPLVLSPSSERVQIARSSAVNADQVNMAFTLTDNGTLFTCDSGDSLLSGLTVNLAEGSCSDLSSLGLGMNLDPFVVHTVNHQSYGTFFGPLAPGPGTVSARIVQIMGVNAVSCGEWALNIEVSGINTATYGLAGGGGPGTTYSLIVTDADSNSQCFKINNAIVGNQISAPTRTTRREVRR